LNGIDLTHVRRLADRFREEPAGGRTPFAATVNWLGGYRTDVRLGEHAPLRGDEPCDLAGTGTGPAPEELLLGAVGQCLAVGWAGTAAAHGVTIRSLEIEVAGAVDLASAYGVADGNPGFDRLEVRVRIDADATRETLEALHEQVVAQAPIPNTISRPVPVDARLV
jgi:uncharacterized OsmC-like protein